MLLINGTIEKINMRETTTAKEKDVLRAFQKLLRSGWDYTTQSMYEDAGKKCYLAPGSAGNIVRKHYKTIITKEMKSFLFSMNGTKHEEKIRLFMVEFDFCKRESRLIIRYIKRSK
jgi:hypothetical protein